MATVAPVVAGAPAPRSRVRAPLWMLPLAIFAGTRLVDTVLLLVMAGHQDLQRFPTESMHVVDPAGASPGYFDLLTNWDGQWYQSVAQDGYPHHLPRVDGEVAQNAWGFSPLYPALVRAVMALTSLPFAPAASIVSILAGAAAMVLLFRLLQPRVGVFNASMTVLAISMSPAGVILQAAYTESVALLALVGCLTLLVERRYGALAVLVVVLSLARPVVLPFAVLLLLHGVLRWRHRDEDPFPASERRRWLLATVVALASTALVPAACALWTGDLDAFVQTRRAWSVSTAHPISWATAIIEDPLGGHALVVLVVTVVVGAALTRPSARSLGTDLRLWVPVYALFMLVTTSPIGGYFRYALLALLPWWPVTGATQPSRARAAVLAGFTVAFGVVWQVAWLRYSYLLGTDIRMLP